MHIQLRNSIPYSYVNRYLHFRPDDLNWLISEKETKEVCIAGVCQLYGTSNARLPSSLKLVTISRTRLPSQKPLICLPLTGKSISLFLFTKLWVTLWLNSCRMYGSTRQCTRCGEQIAAFDAVYRVHQKVYHVTCFTCTTCKRPLKTGDKYYSRGDGIYCEHDGQATKGDFTS